MAMEGMEDMDSHFLCRYLLRTRDDLTWSILRLVQEVRYRTDYILGMDHRMYQNVAVRDPRHNMEHCLVLGCLRDAIHREYQL